MKIHYFKDINWEGNLSHLRIIVRVEKKYASTESPTNGQVGEERSNVLACQTIHLTCQAHMNSGGQPLTLPIYL